ncbi:hypothetical protein Pan54_22720 [Rubinisphaera italica]|uniref:Uncharacterized protein n=1 Tax=Rubinisphaera italica TaxID=2527969 RepID=A0A5C5XEK6_9PLAN|nr:hypothetical protein Pan54_22720 [Rubinisphaera italica]
MKELLGMCIIIFPLLEKHTHSFSKEDHDILLGIDQHTRQTDSLVRSRQPGKLLQFVDQLTQRCTELNGSFIAMVEVCGVKRLADSHRHNHC